MNEIRYLLENTLFVPICVVSIAFYIIIFFKFKSSNNKSRYDADAGSYKNTLRFNKGRWGEHIVAENLAELNKDYVVINDVMLEVNNRTAQIDHIVVSVYGIFVIETKNYGGYLRGDEDDNYISHSYGEKTYMIYNPLKQNRNHVRMLMAATGIKNKYLFVPILTISDECEFEIKSSTEIATFSSLYSSIRRYNKKVLTRDEVEEIAEMINELNVVDEKERADHVERARLNSECPF